MGAFASSSGLFRPIDEIVDADVFDFKRVRELCVANFTAPLANLLGEFEVFGHLRYAASSASPDFFSIEFIVPDELPCLGGRRGRQKIG